MSATMQDVDAWWDSPQTERKLILNGSSVGPASTKSLLLERAVCIATNALQIARAAKHLDTGKLCRD